MARRSSSSCWFNPPVSPEPDDGLSHQLPTFLALEPLGYDIEVVPDQLVKFIDRHAQLGRIGRFDKENCLRLRAHPDEVGLRVAGEVAGDQRTVVHLPRQLAHLVDAVDRIESHGRRSQD